MQDLANMITYLNLLSAEYNMKIDWNNSDIDKKQLNFIGGTNEQIVEFCWKLEDYIKGMEGV